MDHPQPAFNLLMSLPNNAPADESVFADWFAHNEIDAEKGDDIVDHPEVWKVLELPEALVTLSQDDFVCLQPLTGELKLTAVAVGLGIENIEYEPELFSGLKYLPAGHDSTVFAFWKGMLISVGETADSASSAVEYTLERLEELELGNGAFEAEMETARVSEWI